MSIAKDLQRVSSWCHKHFEYKHDITARKTVEHWPDRPQIAAFIAFHQLFGWKWIDDCDGFAALAQFILKALGYRPRLVYCITETGEPHLVLEIEGFILDNRSYWVRNRDSVPYTWMSISGYNKGDPWYPIYG